jgi:hypothetical protein
VARVEKLRAKAIHLFEEAETQENIRNTRWGALNALTEQIEHFGEGRVPKSLLLDAATPKTLAQDIAKGARVIKGLDVEKKSTLAKQLLTWKR